MITDRDREIINFIDKIGFSTINHIADLFFNDNSFSYDLARRRLKKIRVIDTITSISVINSARNKNNRPLMLSFRLFIDFPLLQGLR